MTACVRMNVVSHPKLDAFTAREGCEELPAGMPVLFPRYDVAYSVVASSLGGAATKGIDCMARVSKLNDAEIHQMLATRQGWSVKNNKLHKEYKFEDFVHAFGFMATAAMRIERLDHHPEWCNVYNAVRVDLTTHDCGGISQKDFELAEILDELAAKLQ